MENEEFATICKSCLQKGNSFHGQSDNNSVKTKCTQWLEKCETSEDTSSLNSSEYASASSKSVEQFGNCENQHVFDSQNAWCSSLIDSLEKIHETTEISKQDGSILGNININNSRKIHVGNVTYVTGPISFNQNVSLKKNCRTTNTILLQDLKKIHL